MTNPEILEILRPAQRRIAEARWQEPNPVTAIMAKIPGGSWTDSPVHVCPECGSASFSARTLPLTDTGKLPWLLTCHHGHEWTHTPDRKAA